MRQMARIQFDAVISECSCSVHAESAQRMLWELCCAGLAVYSAAIGRAEPAAVPSSQFLAARAAGVGGAESAVLSSSSKFAAGDVTRGPCARPKLHPCLGLWHLGGIRRLAEDASEPVTRSSPHCFGLNRQPTQQLRLRMYGSSFCCAEAEELAEAVTI